MILLNSEDWEIQFLQIWETELWKEDVLITWSLESLGEDGPGVQALSVTQGLLHAPTSPPQPLWSIYHSTGALGGISVRWV